MYQELDEVFQEYVDILVEHAGTALWPERRAALESFRRGIDGCPEEDLAAAVHSLVGDPPDDIEPAEILYRAIITAYLEQLDESVVTNPDQALIYSLSLDKGHLDGATSWLRDHPEFLGSQES